jgi:hypothetical protein
MNNKVFLKTVERYHTTVWVCAYLLIWKSADGMALLESYCSVEKDMLTVLILQAFII